jgi:RNA-directed DNA polymerase
MKIATQSQRSASDPAAQLNLCSWRELEFLLGFSRSRIRSIASRAGSYYAPFVKTENHRPFQKKFRLNPKRRIIDNPLDPLKEIQKRINKRLLDVAELPAFFYGGVSGKNLNDNLRCHLASKALVTLDIANFFPSVKPPMVYAVWRNVLGCSPEIAGILTKLTTFQRKLPQGASTSTTLANLVLARLYPQIQVRCEELNIRCSTWVDDLAFSGEYPQQMISLVVDLLKRAGFDVSRKKLKVMRAGERKVLNNIILGQFPSVDKTRISQARAGIHKLNLNLIEEKSIQQYLRELKGRIRFIRTINNRQGDKLMAELREAIVALSIEFS